MTRKKRILAALMHGVGYNIVEVAVIAIISVVHFIGGELHAWFLWMIFLAAAIWTVLASSRDAQEEAQELTRLREVFIFDFILGALFMGILSAMTTRYGMGYGVIFFLAAVQNLRYSGLVYDWLQEERKHDYDSERDNLP